ncbi:hypothetical protein [Mycobacterium dioxanotrophicus]|uniref:hypothetical protein n=1 Tax=Mycobacterium dioxanotrophicus TaxID=482462 RepID=UPI0012FA9802|nr:hypothetical protein [Mycobacterium dioxanotrophicus]
MANQNLSHLKILLNRPGSMQSIKSDVIGGSHAFRSEQRDAERQSAVALAQFGGVRERRQIPRRAIERLRRRYARVHRPSAFRVLPRLAEPTEM